MKKDLKYWQKEKTIMGRHMFPSLDQPQELKIEHCNVCGKDFWDFNLTYCKECRKGYCLDCFGAGCQGDCEGLYCKDCLTTCEYCGKGFCLGCFGDGYCVSCGKEHCLSCFSGAKCESCGAAYCEECVGDKNCQECGGSKKS